MLRFLFGIRSLIMSHRSSPPSRLNPPKILPATVLGLLNARRGRRERPHWAEPRGVYWAKHLSCGRRILYSVDSNGDEVKRLRLDPTADSDEAIDYLETHLDLVDPLRPALRIVRSA